MSVSFDYYRTFYYVGKYGSFTQAAKIMHNNQPNITRTMNNLEAELGCRLFVRSRKGITLTPEGEKLFVHIESAYNQILIGEAEVAAGRELKEGFLSIAISEIALHGFMLPVLQSFKQAHPGIHIRLLNHSTPQGIKAVQRGLAELAVISSPAGMSGSLEETVIRSFREILIAGKGYEDLSRREITLRDLAAYPLITLSRGTTSFAFLQELFASEGLILDPSVEAATTDQILPMVAHDIGLGFIPEAFAEVPLKQGDVFRVRLRREIPTRNICLIQDKSRPLSMAALALKKAIFNYR